MIPKSRSGMTSGGPRTASQSNQQSVGLTTEMKVPATPLNKEGMKGVATSSGPGRQVSDITYYHNQFIKKNKEISDQIYKMKNQIDQLQKDSENYNIYEKQFDELTKEVSKLEGTLADYNLASDKYRTHVSPNDLNVYCQQVRARNNKDRMEIDAIFTERKRVDEEIVLLEREMDQISNEMTTQLQSLDPSSQKKYQMLQNERQQLMQLSQQRHIELEELGRQIFDVERYIKSDQNLKEFTQYESDYKKLEKEKKSIQWEVELLDLKEDDGKKYLVDKAKLLKTEIQDVDDKLDNLKDSNDNYRRLLREMSQASESNKEDENQKLELLRQREKEMNQFIQNFPQVKQNELDEQVKLRENIVGLLQHISENTTQATQLPDKPQFNQLKEELMYKQQQVQSAEQTKIMLQEQLQFYQKDLEKIMGIDDRLNSEITQYRTKMDQLRSEISIFENIDSVQSQFEMNKKTLERTIVLFNDRVLHLKNQTDMIAKEYTRLKSQVNSSKEHTELLNLLKKLRDHENSVFSLNEYIESMARSIDYNDIKHECLTLVDRINKETINIHLNS